MKNSQVDFTSCKLRKFENIQNFWSIAACIDERFSLEDPTWCFGGRMLVRCIGVVAKLVFWLIIRRWGLGVWWCRFGLRFRGLWIGLIVIWVLGPSAFGFKMRTCTLPTSFLRVVLFATSATLRVCFLLSRFALLGIFLFFLFQFFAVLFFVVFKWQKVGFIHNVFVESFWFIEKSQNDLWITQNCRSSKILHFFKFLCNFRQTFDRHRGLQVVETFNKEKIRFPVRFCQEIYAVLKNVSNWPRIPQKVAIFIRLSHAICVQFPRDLRV